MKTRLIACFVLLLAGCATQKTAPALSPAETHLVDLMARRLVIARQVAWNKYQNSTPVRDKQREAEILNFLVAEGTKAGLSPKEVERFFQAQISASRLVQSELIHGWRRGATLPVFAPYDLRTQIRPQLDQINREMLRELTTMKLPPANHALSNYAWTVLRHDGFSWIVTWNAIAPVR